MTHTVVPSLRYMLHLERAKRDLTQEEAARYLHLSAPALRNLEGGLRRAPHPRTLAKVAAGYGLSLEDLYVAVERELQDKQHDAA